MITPSIAILAGGQSLRMGRDKAALLYEGETFLARIATSASAVSDRVLVVGRDASKVGTSDGEVFDGVEFFEDDVPDLGPLGGLMTALDVVDGPVALVGCDMPLVDPAAFRWLFESFRDSRAEHGLVPRCDGRFQPMFAVYRSACRELIDELIADERRALRRLIELGGFREVEVPNEVAERLWNINTREDFRDLVRSTE